jgi:integrase
MANRVAWLTKRVKIGGQWFVRKPIVKPTGFVTEKVEHNGHSVHASGTFVLEWYEAGKRQRKPLSDSTSEAQDALRKKLQTLEARAHGLTVVEDKGSKGKVSLEAAVREYLEEVKLNRAHKTHLAYKRALGMLVSANPGCDFVQDLERRNLMVHFIRAMKEAGLGDRTQNNLFGAIVTFLHSQDHPVVTRKDAPDYTETEIETYSTEELGELFGACTPAERLVFQFFLGTGCREREVTFATWKDVDLTAGTFTVKAKPAMGFKPKDSEERTIPIPSSLVRDLNAWKAMHPKSLLIFPNGQGRRVELRALQLGALREASHLQGPRGLRAVLSSQVPPHVREHAPAGWRGRADGATVARSLGFGDDQLLPEGHQREAKGCAREGGCDFRWDRRAADAPERSGDDPVSRPIKDAQE